LRSIHVPQLSLKMHLAPLRPFAPLKRRKRLSTGTTNTWKQLTRKARRNRSSS
ncbi:MAG: hypothetical protein M1823_009098, partial [Watsoniomyces obsoletus]